MPLFNFIEKEVNLNEILDPKKGLEVVSSGTYPYMHVLDLSKTKTSTFEDMQTELFYTKNSYSDYTIKKSRGKILRIGAQRFVSWEDGFLNHVSGVESEMSIAQSVGSVEGITNVVRIGYHSFIIEKLGASSVEFYKTDDMFLTFKKISVFDFSDYDPGSCIISYIDNNKAVIVNTISGHIKVINYIDGSIIIEYDATLDGSEKFDYCDKTETLFFFNNSSLELRSIIGNVDTLVAQDVIGFSKCGDYFFFGISDGSFLRMPVTYQGNPEIEIETIHSHCKGFIEGYNPLNLYIVEDSSESPSKCRLAYLDNKMCNYLYPFYVVTDNYLANDYKYVTYCPALINHFANDNAVPFYRNNSLKLFNNGSEKYIYVFPENGGVNLNSMLIGYALAGRIDHITRYNELPFIHIASDGIGAERINQPDIRNFFDFVCFQKTNPDTIQKFFYIKYNNF
jgi:hypothetical protein